MKDISVDIEELKLNIPRSDETMKKELRRPSHCTQEIADFMHESIDKETKDNTLDGLKLLWECRPTAKNKEDKKTTRKELTQTKRVSLPSLIPEVSSESKDSSEREDMSELYNDYDALKYNIKILYKAHSECMQLNGLFDRILTLGSISATFITTMLLALKDISVGNDNHLYITECAISGAATGFVAMNNKFENGAKKQQHLDIVNKLRKLEVEISVKEKTKENYNKYKSQFISDLGDVTIFRQIREKYEIDNLSDGLF